MALVIEKTEVAYIKSFPCLGVKKTFQVLRRILQICAMDADILS